MQRNPHNKGQWGRSSQGGPFSSFPARLEHQFGFQAGLSSAENARRQRSRSTFCFIILAALVLVLLDAGGLAPRVFPSKTKGPTTSTSTTTSSSRTRGRRDIDVSGVHQESNVALEKDSNPPKETTLPAGTLTHEKTEEAKESKSEEVSQGVKANEGLKTNEGLKANEGGPLSLSCGGSGPPCLYRGAVWRPQAYHWLTKCWAKHSAEPPFIVEEVLHNKQCPNECNGHGVCNHETGECRCQMGWKGMDCGEDDVYECNLNGTKEWPLGTWLPTICAGHCDTHTSRCYCGEGTRFPKRPLRHPCGFLFDKKNNKFDLGHVDRKVLYHEKYGYCNFDPLAKRTKEETEELLALTIDSGCGGECMDGLSGEKCAVPSQAYCVAQCSGNGDCLSGHCKCKDGFYGMDCATPSALSPQTKLKNSLFLHGLPSPPKAEDTTQPALRVEPVLTDDTVAVSRRRPLIYVYDLPREFTTHHLESRIFKFYCVPRLYTDFNTTLYNSGWLYSMEMAVVESIMGSSHRTMNAEEADYFFVPMMGGCIQVRADENPRMFMQSPLKYQGSRPYFAADFYLGAQEHISQHYPYWNRTGGGDHIWIFPWDEGACSAPKAIWPSILLSHWGNTMTKHNYSTTAYPADSWRNMPLEYRGAHPCFDPSKDVVMPAFKMPSSDHLKKRLWERPIQQRTTFFYFNGNLGRNYGGRPEPEYSMGIRQRVAAFYAHAEDKTGLGPLRFHPNVKVSAQRAIDYSEELASSRFCGVFPGDGFSARMEDSVLHGCIPVVIQDGIEMAFENFLDLTNFSVRVAESDIRLTIDILQAIPEERVQRMQEAVSRVALRWYYRSFLLMEEDRQRKAKRPQSEWEGPLKDWLGDDAIDTLIQILAVKLENDPWRRTLAKQTGKIGECRLSSVKYSSKQL